MEASERKLKGRAGVGGLNVKARQGKAGWMDGLVEWLNGDE